jgi:hypothetical protein
MKANRYIILTVFSLFSSSLMAQGEESPVDYFNAVIQEYNKVSVKNMNYLSTSVHSENDNEVDAARKDVMKQIEKSIASIQNIKAYKGDEKLKQDALEVLKIEQGTYQTDFSDAILLKKDSKSSFEAMEKYYKAQEKAEKKLSQASDKLALAQKNFAEKYKFELKTDEQNRALQANITRLNQYTRDIFLAYFKASKNNGIFFDALNANKVSAMESARLNILSSTEEGINKIKNIGSFDGDKSYMEKSIAVLQYYKSLASKDFVTLVKVTGKKDTERTQADVDQYNGVINDYNVKNQKYINEFNEANRKILQKTIPKK